MAKSSIFPTHNGRAPNNNIPSQPFDENEVRFPEDDEENQIYIGARYMAPFPSQKPVTNPAVVAFIHSIDFSVSLTPEMLRSLILEKFAPSLDTSKAKLQLFISDPKHDGDEYFELTNNDGLQISLRVTGASDRSTR